jgi:hypothetical protein
MITAPVRRAAPWLFRATKAYRPGSPSPSPSGRIVGKDRCNNKIQATGGIDAFSAYRDENGFGIVKARPSAHFKEDEADRMTAHEAAVLRAAAPATIDEIIPARDEVGNYR